MNVLVVAAHPDDEVLGCGGAIARHAIRGDHVAVVILGEGITSRDKELVPDRHSRELSALRHAAESASRALGVHELRLHGLPDNRLDTHPLLEIVKLVESAITEFSPEMVYTHHRGDLNLDHGIVGRAVTTACRPQPGVGVRSILAFEVASSTEWEPRPSEAFQPNWFVDISNCLDAKLRALKAYQSELRDWPHPRSLEAVEALARWRGASVGVDAAEAFHLLRNIVK